MAEEQIYWCRTEELNSVVQSLNCPPESLMMLERIPTTFLQEAQRENSICLRKYDADYDFDAWERGCIFNDDFELHWEKENGQFTVVYIGREISLPIFTEEESVKLSDMQTEVVAYYLWGEKVTKDNLKLIGQPETANLFLELQIPRLLRYPVSNRNERFRVKLSVKHYLNPGTGVLEFYRFLHLEEE
jgi:hypothetical protein